MTVTAQNLVLNGGFETWTDATTPADWTKAENVDQESVEIHSGTYSAKHTGGTKDIFQNIAIEAGEDYQLSFWYKVVPGDGEDSRIWCVWRDGTNTGLYDDTQGSIRGPEGDYLPNGSGEWLYHSAVVTAPAAAASLDLEVRTYSGAVTYWDDFVFEKYVDIVAPVATIDPINASTGVSVLTDITIAFDEPVQNVGGGEITDPSGLVVVKETDAAGLDVAFTAVINAEKDLITITPDAALSYEQTYYVALNANAVEDVNGNALDVLQSATFTTNGPLEVTYPAGGEVFYPGEDIHIDWTTDLTENLSFWVSFDAGTTWETFIVDVDPALGTIDYTIPVDSDASIEAMVRISKATDVTFADVIDDSEVFAIVPMLTINEIQSHTGDGNSNYMDTICLTSGIVTYANGTDSYYIHVGESDSTAIVVIDDVNQPSIGDEIVIAGTVVEYYSLTQMDTIFYYDLISTGNNLYPPIDLDYAGGNEPSESIIVKLSSALVVEEANSYGEVEVEYGSGVILIDDLYFEATLNLGGTYDITGPLSYAYGKWRVYPTEAGDVVEIPSSETGVSSEAYTVDDGLETIVDIPYSTDLATFIENIDPVYGATFEVFEADGVTLASDLLSDYKLIVTSQDGSTTKTYILTKDPVSTIATVTSLVYTIDDGAGTIDGVLFKASVEIFEEYLVPALGATFVTYQADGATEATDLMTGYKLIVTAEDMTTTKTYTITLETDYPAGLIFSEYIEANTGNNKAIELFNPSDEPVKLNYYQIGIMSNGGDDWEYFHTFPAGAVLESHGTWVMLADGATMYAGVPDEILFYTDHASAVHHNGNDARGLLIVTGEDTTLVDVIGIIEADPTGWDVAGVANATTDHTLLRKGFITEGNTDWASSAGTNADDSEWIVLDANFFDSLGVHTLVLPVPSDDATLSALTVGGTAVSGFSPAQLTYFVTLDAGTTDTPVVTATATDGDLATVDIADAADVNGDETARTTTITVTAEDEETVKTYTIVFTVEVGVESSMFSKVRVYPVPSASKLYIENVSEVQSLTVFDITGAAMMSIDNSGQEMLTIDVSDLNSGLYMIRMISEKASGVVRFIKE